MVCTVKDIMNIMEKIAPKELAENWDNVGLMVGNENQEVRKILIALDGIEEVLEEAIEKNVDLIITHHPFILFQKIKNITKSDYLGDKIYKLIENKISIFSAHTNLDSVEKGVNDALCDILGIKNTTILDDESGIGRIGELEEEITFIEYAKKINESLNTKGILHLVGDGNKKIKRVSVCGGSGASFINISAGKGADLYVTGDIKYHEAQNALEKNMAIADVTHYCGEVIIVPVLVDMIKEYSNDNNYDLEVIQSQVNGQTFWNL